MKTDLEVEVEVDLRPLGKVLIFRDRQTHRTFLLYIDKGCLSYYPGGDTFTLMHNGESACGILDEETIILTGGRGHNYVTRLVCFLSILQDTKISFNLEAQCTWRINLPHCTNHHIIFMFCTCHQLKFTDMISTALCRSCHNYLNRENNTSVVLFLLLG